MQSLNILDRARLHCSLLERLPSAIWVQKWGSSSPFPYDDRMGTYLKATGSEEVAEMADSVAGDLRADDDVLAIPEKYYDRIIEIDLSALEPYINGQLLLPMQLHLFLKFAESSD